MTKPLGNEDLSSQPGERVVDKPELPPQGITNENDVLTEQLAGEMHLKRGRFGKFEVFSDEHQRLGGTDRYPSPMTYLAMAIGFWLLTQVARYAHMMKMKVGGASCRVVFRKHLGGSVIKGTVFNRWESVTTHLKVDSDEPADKLAHLIRNAKAGCFAEGLITQQVPLVSHVEVNGKPFQIDGVPGEASQVKRPR